MTDPHTKCIASHWKKIIENPLRENAFLVMDSAEFKGIKFAKIHGLPDIFHSIENLI